MNKRIPPVYSAPNIHLEEPDCKLFVRATSSFQDFHELTYQIHIISLLTKSRSFSIEIWYLNAHFVTLFTFEPQAMFHF